MKILVDAYAIWKKVFETVNNNKCNINHKGDDT